MHTPDSPFYTEDHQAFRDAVQESRTAASDEEDSGEPG